MFHFAVHILEGILVRYRWIFVCFFLLPLSTVYNLLFYTRNWIVFNLLSSPEKHAKRVRNVQQQVQKWQETGKDVHMCTGRPGWQTMSFREGIYKKTMYKIDVNLSDILNIDLKKQTICVEPLVTMGQISAALIPLGWTLAVLPELDDLTVGGLIMGTGIETSSHKYGLFQHICVSFELVLADASVIQCSKENYPDLFYAVPWSHGTLGFLCSAVLQIIPAKKYVKVNYQPVHSLKELTSVFSKEAMKPDAADFVEGIVFTPNSGVIMTADLVDVAESSKVNRIGLYFKPWFYKHVEKFLETGWTTEFIPLRDYYHRHSRSIFWQLKYIIPFGNSFLFRFLCGWMVPPKVSLLKLTQGATVKKLYEKHQLIQDILVPVSKLEEALKFMDEEIKIYPLWLCPFISLNTPGFIHPVSEADEMYVDIGAYGEPKLLNYEAKTTTRKLEKFVRNVNGFQMLYADTYMTKEEFHEMFDHTLYDNVRKSLKDCEKGFPDVYEKINRSARY